MLPDEIASIFFGSVVSCGHFDLVPLAFDCIVCGTQADFLSLFGELFYLDRAL